MNDCMKIMGSSNPISHSAHYSFHIAELMYPNIDINFFLSKVLHSLVAYVVENILWDEYTCLATNFTVECTQKKCQH